MALSIITSLQLHKVITIMSDTTAILAGFTKELIADGGEFSLHIFVKPDTDLDGSFKVYDADECEFLKINGWLFSFEEVTP